jgi:hypothetical protein
MRHAFVSCVVILILWRSAAAPAEERAPLIPDRDWTGDVKVWIARAMVSEAGWDETQDHIAVAFVLLRRWRLAQKQFPGYSMVSVIRRYCAGFRDMALTKRQRWIKNMTLDGQRPAGWPDDIFWRDYRDRWLAVLNLTEAWRRGEHPDPCRGKSMYWGGPMDRPSKRMIRMDCGATKNFFYTVKPLLEEPDVPRFGKGDSL